MIPLLIAISTCFAIAAQTPPGNGLDILGTHYSNRLALLIRHVESVTKTNVVFVSNDQGGDNSVILVEGKWQISLRPHSSEDNVAHELTHTLLGAEGYTNVFMIPGYSLSRFIRSAIASDFDHLLINQRLHEEGYYPEKGFMAGMKDQYKSFAATHVIVKTPTQRAMLAVQVIHELMKHVYYVGTQDAENAILTAYPPYKDQWLAIKREIDAFLREPTPLQEWHLVEVYCDTMNKMFSESGLDLVFSDLVGFSPLPVTKGQLNTSASKTLSEKFDPKTGLVRIRAGSVLVAAGTGNRPNLAVSLTEFSSAVNLKLLELDL
jgi:hypothetical protein